MLTIPAAALEGRRRDAAGPSERDIAQVQHGQAVNLPDHFACRIDHDRSVGNHLTEALFVLV